jgi:hypothetical protein
MPGKYSQDDFAKALAPLAAVFDRLRHTSYVGPAQGSIAHDDARTRIGRTTWVLSVPAAAVGLDHLAAWQHLRLRAALQPSFAHFSLIRGAAEGCSVARWLCDSTIPAGERLARGAGAQLEDYGERIKYERRLGNELPKLSGRGRTGAQRKADFEKELHSLGITPIALPSATELFARYFFTKPDVVGGEAFFRQISGIIHAKVWSLHALSERGEVTWHGDELGAVATRANEETAYAATILAMQLAESAVGDIETYSRAK